MTKIVLFLATILFLSPTLAREPVKVLASVHPLALVAASVVEPEHLHTLVAGHMSPHDFALRPSDISHLQQADIIIWSGAKAEPYLRHFVNRWPDKIWLNAADYAPDNAAPDPHWWLSPEAMIGLQAALAEQLGQNSDDFRQQVEQTLATSDALLAPVREHGFFVFHRAYDHWVQALQLKQKGALTLSPEHKPGLKTMAKLRTQLAQGNVHCVFSEPQYDPALVDALIGDMKIQRAELDPMAADITLSSQGYGQFLLQLAQRAAGCLTPPSDA